MAELLPCPFCRGTKLKIEQKTSSTTRWNSETKHSDKLVVVTVRCNKCHTRGPTTSMYAGWRDDPVKTLEAKAIELWNTRPAIVEYGYETAQQKGNTNE